MRGLFITGTDTGVGKTILSAALLTAMTAEGKRVRAYKPVVTGLDDQAEVAARGGWPPDHELLAAAAGMNPDEVAPLRYGPAVSPHLAAQLAGERIDPSRLLAGARTVAGTDASTASTASGGGDLLARETAAGEAAASAAEASDAVGTLIVEGVGGLLTPLAEDYTVCDLAVALELPVLIAARPGLGTINHTLLTLRVARAAGLYVRAVVLTPWPEEPTELERSNRETIAHVGGVEVEGLGPVVSPDPVHLALAGAELCGKLKHRGAGS